MDFMQAVKAMKDGKKVRLSTWISKGYLVILNGLFVFVDMNAEDHTIQPSVVISDNWKIVEEPKKTLHDKRVNTEDYQYEGGVCVLGDDLI